MLVKATDDAVHLPESSEYLLIAKQSTPQHGDLVLAFDVIISRLPAIVIGNGSVPRISALPQSASAS
jgi:hypothetical protein